MVSGFMFFKGWVRWYLFLGEVGEGGTCGRRFSGTREPGKSGR